MMEIRKNLLAFILASRVCFFGLFLSVFFVESYDLANFRKHPFHTSGRVMGRGKKGAELLRNKKGAC